ncbi:MAG: carotenoid oxygenase family protein [Pseudomonadota bacterium]
MLPDPIDTAAVPQLNGIFAPTVDEIDTRPLEVVQGALPRDLVGCYLRNGPNCRFTPLGSYTYPLDGDGMVHGLWFDGDSARYANHFVRTPALEVEERAGRALWPGVMTGQFPGADEVGQELAGTDRDAPSIHVIRHAGRILALAEGARAFELAGDLGTIGPYTFDGILPSGLCAHPKIDPVTGEMVLFRYGLESPPWLSWSVVGADGRVTRCETPIDLDGPYMIHDCAITASYLVLYVCPLRFDVKAANRGGSLLAWQPELGTRIVAVERASGAARWFDAAPCWIWHFANAYERSTERGSTEIVVDYPCWSHAGMGLVSEPVTGGVVRARLDMASGRASFQDLSDEMSEFPRLDDRRVGQCHRYFHMAAKDPDSPTKVAGEWNRLVRYDMETGRIQERRGGTTRFGEAVFAPRRCSRDESDGYIVTYAYDGETLSTSFVILDAADIAAEPVATLRMPQRVPFGLHGSWLPAD